MSKTNNKNENKSIGLFDLSGQLAFYGAYHNQSVNIVIHTICIPIILFTALIMGTTSGPFFEIESLKEYEKFGLVFNLPFFTICIYGFYYFLLEPFVGGTYNIILIGMWLGASYLYSNFGSQAVVYAIGVHCIAWIFQFIGHGVFERRKPALLDSLVQALVLAPLFVWLHLFFGVFNYRPKLAKEVQAKIDRNISLHKKN